MHLMINGIDAMKRPPFVSSAHRSVADYVDGDTQEGMDMHPSRRD
jgi:hypothetical protein